MTERLAALQTALRATVEDPEFLAEASFPATVRKVLFDPAGAHPDFADYARAQSWGQVCRLILDAEGGSACAA